jgi:hypothetical protein
MKALRFVVALLMLASPSMPQELPTSPANQSPEQRGLLVFFRPKRFFGSGLTPSIYLNGVQLARLDNGRFFSIWVPSGKHKIESTMKHAPLELEIKPGEAVYLEMAILAGTWRGGGRIIPSPPEDALATIKKLKPLDRKWVVEEKVVFDTKVPAGD